MSDQYDDEFLFVDPELRFLTGGEAKNALKQVSDESFVDPEKGVVHVPRERWKVAQQYERRTWMEAGAHALDDHNVEHAAQFDGWRALAGRRFHRAIELGCGPFTNLRLIGRLATIDRCVLLDPLIREYLSHRHCTYRRGIVISSEKPRYARLGGTLAGRAIRRLAAKVAPRAMWDGIPVERMIASPIEEMPDAGTFDLVVMINVLEHCFDAEAIFAKILKLTMPGSVFVFHDKLYAAGRVAEDAHRHYDAGHPLRIDRRLIEQFLAANFEPDFRREVVLRDEYHGFDIEEETIYFIGRRRQGQE